MLLLVTGVQTCADRKSTRLNSSHDQISYAVFCLKKTRHTRRRARRISRARYTRSAPCHTRKPRAGRDEDAVVARTCGERYGRFVVFFFLNDGPPPESNLLPHPHPLRT